MSALPLVSLACVSAWAGLVVVAQLANPEQSALSMGLSGLATGRYGWLMRLAFVVRGVAALSLVGAVSTLASEAAQSGLGLILLALWGGASTLLAAYDTDMPGDEPTAHGRAHALIAFVAYLGVGVGTVLVSWGLRGVPSTAGVARWALPIALFAAVMLVIQFAGFAAAARDAAAGAPGAPREPGGPSEPGAPVTHAAPPPAFRGLGRYAGLLQRVFLVLVMLWTALVAAGL